MRKFHHINKGDYLAARCTFDSRTSNHVVSIGATAGDEMCNLYLMYYTPHEDDDMRLCINEQIYDLDKSFPDDSDQTFEELSMEQPVSYSNHDQNQLDTNSVIPQKEKKQGEQQHLSSFHGWTPDIGLWIFESTFYPKSIV